MKNGWGHIAEKAARKKKKGISTSKKKKYFSEIWWVKFRS